MKSVKLLTISVVTLVLIFCLATVSKAEPIGTAFTYQGHLYDANYAADGLYDFAFKLYDANVGGSEVGTDVNVADVDVIDAYFTVELDFGSEVFDGNAVWLEIGVRPGDLDDPNIYTVLEPRQEITPTPYALYAKTAGGGASGADIDWIISGNDMYSGVPGNVGIGTTSPGEKLDVEGNINVDSVYKINGETVLSVAGTENTLVGVDVGPNNTGYNNSAVGYQALYSNTTGFFNSAVGHMALYSNTTGRDNTAVGTRALWSSTTGGNNSAVGRGALYANTTGEDNSAVGRIALYSNTTGFDNTAIGKEALRSNTTGYQNSAVGNEALWSNSTGNSNSAIGSRALYFNTTGSNNSAMGNYALQSNTEGFDNSAMGYQAGYSNSIGSGNVFLGFQAGYNETGSNKLYIDNTSTITPLIYGEFDNDIVAINGSLGIGTASPTEALEVNGTAKAVAFVGDGSGLTGLPVTTYTAGTMLDLAGTEFSHSDTSAAASVDNSSGTVVQDITLDSRGHITGTGSYNLDNRYYTESELQSSGSSSVHWDNLSSVPAGFADGVDNVGASDSDWTISGDDIYSAVSGNVGIGTMSPSYKVDVNGHINSSESYKLDGQTVLANAGTLNIFVGKETGASIATGIHNSAVGNYALHDNNEGNYNSAIGNYALYSNTTGHNNSAMGYQALYSNTEGYRNSAMGHGALFSNTTGNYNSAIGRTALYSNTTGHNNSAMGLSALHSNVTGSQNSAVGNYAGYNSTGGGNVFLGFQAGYNETGSNKLYIANSSTNPPLIYGEFDTGNVGIGTTNPSEALDVNGTAKADAFVGDGSGLTNLPAIPDSDWTILGDDVYSAVSGNVGIGTTNPESKLSVGGDGQVNTSVFGGGTIIGVYGIGSLYGVHGSGTTAGVNGVDSDTGSYGRLGYDNYGGYFSGDGYFSGNVGIGTTNPLSKLSVGGDGVADTGVYGTGSYTGVYGKDSNSGTWGRLGYDIYGVFGYGVYGVFGRGTSRGVTGENSQTLSFGRLGYDNYGVYGGGSYGVYGNGSIFGVYGYCLDGSGVNHGVHAEAGSTSSNNAIGVYSKISRNGSGTYWSGYFNDSNSGGTYNGLYADLRSGDSIDIAEYILDTKGDTEAGDVLVADADNDESVIKSSIPYDSAVVGIVSTEPHLIMGMELVMDEETGEMYDDVSAAKLALAGRVPVKVTDENGPIERGDLLTTSSRAGYAMKWTLLDVNQAEDFDELKSMLAENERRRNAVVGKALGNLDSGDGKIVALVNLQ